MKHSPLIGIMVKRKKDRKKILKLYRQFCGEDLKLQLCSFTPAAVSIRGKTVTGIIETEEGFQETVLPLPGAVYNRCYNKTANIFHSAGALRGTRCFNTITHFNKWVVYTLLEQSGLKRNLPDTFLYDPNMIPALLATWKLLYLKPVHGHLGKKVYRLELRGSDIFISSHSLAPGIISWENEDIREKINPLLGNQQFIMQKGIRSIQVDNCFFDIRVLVQKNIEGHWAVSVMACRVAYDDFFNTSIYQGIYDAETLLDQVMKRKARNKLLHTLRELSLGVAAALDKHLGLLGELGVDFILDEKKRPWIIEVNGKPQKSIFKGLENFQHQEVIYQRPLEYACYLAQLPPEGQ